MEEKMSILYPVWEDEQPEYRMIPEVTMHDLGLDAVCALVAAATPEKTAVTARGNRSKSYASHTMIRNSMASNTATREAEGAYIMRALSKVTSSVRVAKYRSDVFEDIYRNPEMCEKMMDLLDKINFLREYGTFKKKYDESDGIWDLLHRLEELSDYIGYVEALHDCLDGVDIQSEGLKGLKDHIDTVYHDNGYDALKEDIRQMKASTQDLKSVTVGINLNGGFEADSIGLISINNKYFTKSNIIGNFYEKIAYKGSIKDGTDWEGSMRFHPIQPTAEDMMTLTGGATILGGANVAGGMVNPLMIAKVASIPAGDAAADITRYMDRVTTHMLSIVVKNLRTTLNKYMSVTITEITDLIPEFLFYIRFAEYVKGLEARGMKFSKPAVCERKETDPVSTMEARGIYNLKLTGEDGPSAADIVPNDLDFNEKHTVYILTGANRGGKTTITQAIGQLYCLAQAGIYVPGESFTYCPVDGIFTHFPADEDKTLDLGRLGEECKRFREMFSEATSESLILLNETFSTTSFEEGYYIARDSIRAILKKGIRCIYNTHMHKLAFDVEGFNEEETAGKAASLVILSQNNRASFKVAVAAPEGMSYARTIAEKYGVTYEMLIRGE